MSETNDFSNMPGPWGWPLFGSALQLTSFAEKTLLNWANQHYGNIFRYKMFNQDCVVLNGYDAIKEGLLTNKSEMSGRITGPLFEAIRDNRGLFFIQYGDSWKKWKPFLVKSVASVMPDLPQIICEQADEFLSEDLNDFIENGESVALGDYLLYRMAQVVFLSCMNKEFLSKKKMELQELVSDIYAPLTNIKFSILWFAPSLSYFPPFSSFLADESTRRSKIVNRIIALIEEHRQEKRSHMKDLTCFFFEEYPEPDQGDLESLALIFMDMISAGSATVANQLMWVILFLSKHPDMMGEVQHEIEEGMKGYESIWDLYKCQEKVPFLKAVIQETMRLRPIAPGSLYHRTISDTKVGGYKIPKDVVIHPNLWSVHHDLKYWGPDVEAFRPDRHLDKDGKFVKSDHVIPFSIGERKCTGKPIAEADIFVFLATIMLRYDVSLDPEYEDVDMTGISSAILKPPDYKVRLTYRQTKQNL
uniref:cytochrome P450 2C44-like n=1 Tax=Styela clava TaxID=7725 RepID=UPI00193A62DB|nr:cytochrome P450 2C44-like [Styela clava]